MAGGKRRRNTAKTGDKAIYKQAAEARKNAAASNSKSSAKDDDAMFNEVDKFHNEQEREFIKLDGGDDKDGSDDDSDNAQEAVMDLGVGGNSSEEDDDDDDSESDSDSDDAGSKEKKLNPPSSSSDDDDDDEEEDAEDIRDWGRKKSAYYHGDTADLELGQDEEDAFLEEEAVKDVQTARLEEMDEDDFVLSDDDEDNENDKKKEKSSKKEDDQQTSSRVSAIRDIAKLSSKDRKKLLEKQHPGLPQILSHFSQSVQDLHDRTSLATGALFGGADDGTAQAIGCTPMGKKYLLTKALLQASTALNLAIFLLLKAEESSSSDSSNSNDAFRGSSSSSLVQFHPVMKRLQDWNVLNQKLKGQVEDSVDGLEEQLDNLIKAAKLMESMAAEGDDDDDDEDEDEADTAANKNDEESVDQAPVGVTTDQPGGVEVAGASSSEDDDSSVDEEAVAKSALQNARFGLRPNEIAQDKAANKNGRRRRAVPSDLGDEGGEDAGNDDAARYLASAVNTIEQRAASRKKVRKSAPEDLVGHKEADDDVRRGLEMMEAELGKGFDEEGDDGDGLMGDDDMDGGEDDDMGFYAKMAKKSKDKRENRKNLYAVAPKYPRMEGEIEGERPVGRMIMKNRGLVAHKNKLNRNPRVKKREQYRKALIKRKGTVREVRTDEGHKYGGEETGIKSRISRSRKLGTN